MKEGNFYNRYFLLFSIFCLEFLWSSANGCAENNFERLEIFLKPIFGLNNDDSSIHYTVLGAVFLIVSPIFGLTVSTMVVIFSKYFGILSLSPYPLADKMQKNKLDLERVKRIFCRFCDIERDQQIMENLVSKLEKNNVVNRDWIRRRIEAMHLSANIVVTIFLSVILIRIIDCRFGFDLKIGCLGWMVNIILLFVFSLAAYNSSLEYRNRLFYLFCHGNELQK